MRPPAALRLTVLAAATALTVGACGVPLQQAAEPLASSILPMMKPSPSATATASPEPTVTAAPTTTSRLRLWFVQDDGLVAVESDLPRGTAPSDIVAALSVGPGGDASTTGVRTVARDPLTGSALITVLPQAEPVTVQLKPAFADLPSAEQVLLLGQVVLSLAGAGHSPVAFTDDTGTPVAVPLPDGRLLDTPATARDYNGLIMVP